MSKKEKYSRGAVITATVAWLIFGSMFGAVVVANSQRELGLPSWLVLVLSIGALGCLVVATAVPGQVRCKLVGWLPFGW